MKKIAIALCVIGLLGCANYNQWIKENVPAAGFDSAEWQENFAPAYSFDATATGAKVENGVLTIENITINRITGTTSGHFSIKGYHRTLPQ